MFKKAHFTVFLSLVLGVALGLPAMAQTDTGSSSVDFEVEDATQLTVQDADFTGNPPINWNTTETGSGQGLVLTDFLDYSTNGSSQKVIEITGITNDQEPASGAANDLILAFDPVDTTIDQTGAGQDPNTGYLDWWNSGAVSTPITVINNIGGGGDTVANELVDMDWEITTQEATAGIYRFTVDFTISDQAQ